MKTECSVDACLREARARGWCNTHYYHWRKYGDPLAGRFHGTCSKGHDLTNPENVYQGRTSQCLLCMRDNQRRRNLWSKFRLTPEEWEILFENQGRCCAICETPEAFKWALDHDHGCCPGVRTCGECIRGILCFQCNLRVRALDEWSSDQMVRAQAYVALRPILDLRDSTIERG